MEKKEGSINVDGTEIKNSDLTQEQNSAKTHIQSLRAKITKLQFGIDELLPSLKYYEDNLIKSVKDTASEILTPEQNKKTGES